MNFVHEQSALMHTGRPVRGPGGASKVVERHRRYSTRTLADVQGRLRGLRDGVILSINRPEDFVSYNEVLLEMGTLVLTIGCIEARSGYDLSFKSGDEYIVTIPLRGSGWVSTGGIVVEYGCDDILIVSPLCRVEKHWDGPGEVLSIHVPAERFDVACAGLGLGTLPSMPILRVDRRRARSFLRVVDMICDDLQDSDGPSPFLRSPICIQAEQLLLSLLLEGLSSDACGKRNTVMASPAIPYYVRRAEKFIVANLHLPIGVVEVAHAAGVSIRSIQYGFREFLDSTPMQYLKRARYQRARDILCLGAGHRRISDIAIEIGCSNVSQFSRDYRSMFGEAPSATVAATRGLVA